MKLLVSGAQFYPLLRGQNKIKRTIAQTTLHPIHVMLG
jgi:hypothetical protein